MTLLALVPLILGCAVTGSIVTWPIAEAHGRRAVSHTGRARDAAEVERLARDLYPSIVPTPVAAIEARTNDAPAPVGPAGHRGRHRATWRRSLASWWRALPVRDVDAPVRAAMARTAAPLAIAAGVAVAEGAPAVEVGLLHLAADWRARGCGPIPVAQIFDDHAEPLLASAAA